MRKGILLALIALASLALLYVAIFGRALKQNEPHLRIAFALPQVLITQGAVKINETTYLARAPRQFIARMKEDGYIHVEQMGAAHVFQKGSEWHLSESRMYSAYFMLFSYPIPQ